MGIYQTEIEKMNQPKFISLTSKSKSLTRSSLKDLRHNISRLLHRKQWKDRVKGGFYVIELGSLKETGLWNIHIHMVVDSDYIPQDLLSRMWHEITEDSMVVDIRKVRSYRYATWYLTKYVGKPVSSAGGFITEADRDFVNMLLKGTRLISKFGNTLGLHLVRKDSVCPFCGATDSYVSFTFDIEPALRYYKNQNYCVESYLKRNKPLAEAIESFDWWTFQEDN